MYEIRCMVSDARLANALTALKGLTLGLPSVQVVNNPSAVSTKQAPAPKEYTRGPYKKKRKKPLIMGSLNRKDQGAITVARELLAKSSVGSEILAREIRDATKAVGYSDGAYSHAIKLLKADGTIKPLGFGHYRIIKKPEKATVPTATERNV